MSADAQSQALLEVFGEAILESKDPAPLKEAFDKAMALIRRDDVGWTPIFGGGAGINGDQFGLTLANLKEWSKKIRESIVGSPWIGAGFRRRQNYIWRDRIRYGNIPGESGGTQGKKNVQKLIDNPLNDFHFFGPDARRAREECLFADGIAFWIGNEKTKALEGIPLRQITDQLLDPTGLGHAWAYKREWSETNLTTGKITEHARWYFTDRFVSKRVAHITPRHADGEPDEVDQKHVIFDMIANRSTGLVYGAPDALAAWVWNNVARDAVSDGRAMTRALATFALKASVKGKSGEQNAAISLATPNGAGSTAVVGQANDLVPMSTAGKGYDFDSLRFLVAIVASALDISVVHLTADPAAAGSSYSAAQTLDLPTRLAMEARRAEHVALDQRVLRWMSVESPEVSFVPFFAGDEIYRSIQALVLEYGQDTMSRQELRDRLDDLLSRPNGKVPTEAQRPSALAAKALANAAPKPDPGTTADSGPATPQAASPAQGRSNGTGGQQGGSASNDIRRD